MEYDVQWESLTTYSNKNINKTIVCEDIPNNLINDFINFLGNEEY